MQCSCTHLSPTAWSIMQQETVLIKHRVFKGWHRIELNDLISLCSQPNLQYWWSCKTLIHALKPPCNSCYLVWGEVGPSTIKFNISFLTHWGWGLLNCLNARPGGLNNVIQLLYCVFLKIYNKFANYFCEMKFSGNTNQRP